MSDRSLPGVHDKSRDGSSKGCWWIAGIIVAMPILIIVLIMAGSALFGNESNNDEAQSIVACEKEVKANLKAPSTANLSSTARGSDGKYTVTGQVDAENSFGAKVLNSYQCSVSISGDYATATITEWR